MFNMRYVAILLLTYICAAAPVQVWAIDQASTVTALRLANTITGGYMPASDPLFTQMVTQIQAGDLKGAATTAATSNYFANYLARRLAFQMQTPALDATVTTDSDATAFVIAHFIGGPGWNPSISTIWSENQTYVVNVPVSGVTTATHINQVPGATAFKVSVEDIDWSSQMIQAGPQQAYSLQSATYPNTPAFMAIPSQDIGGYATASTSPYPKAAVMDQSMAQYGAYLGTNIRLIEGIWEVSTGLSLVDFEDTEYAATDILQAQAVPRFVPENNPNFYVGQGQSACISCHGGGLSALAHGYATVADVFEYTSVGFAYNDMAATKVNTRKSLGSTVANRQATLNCNLTATPSLACNPDSSDNQNAPLATNWDLSSWQGSGILSTMGWNGPIQGTGLNELGAAIGQANIVYEFLTKRVIQEICPVGMFTASDVSNIALAANPMAVVPGSDDIRTIVALVAINPSCQ